MSLLPLRGLSVCDMYVCIYLLNISNYYFHVVVNVPTGLPYGLHIGEWPIIWVNLFINLYEQDCLKT
jgi:hypothetical protein